MRRLAGNNLHERLRTANSQVIEGLPTRVCLADRVIDKRGAKARTPKRAVVGGAQRRVLGTTAGGGKHTRVAFAAHERSLGLGAEHHGDVDPRSNQLLEKQVQGSRPDAAAH